MTIYEKIEKIENSIVSLAGDSNSKGDKGKDSDKYVSKDKMEEVIKPRIKAENLFLKREVVDSDVKMINYNETKKYFDKYTKTEKIETSEKVMYIATVKMLFTFIDTQTGEQVSFQFGASANNNSNGGNAYGSAISYSIRNFYKTVFNITTGEKDSFISEGDVVQLENNTKIIEEKIEPKQEIEKQSETKEEKIKKAKSMVVPFGKFKGKTVEQICAEEETYLNFLAQASKDPKLANACKYLISLSVA